MGGGREYLGGFTRERERQRVGGGRFDRNRVVAAMTVAPAGVAFLFDVVHFAARCHLAGLADDAAASEGREAEKSDEAHHTCHCLSNSCTGANETGRLRFH